ncbi:MAG: acetoacetate metabolism regulatory protein AtoC [Gemmatimonadales bacterium]|nr:MAG: acetoacetate metabolism regulatory protein AtoC [Gemmatimonadales bacterium]
MADHPVLAVLSLSDSFQSLWSDLASELEAELRFVSRVAEAAGPEVVAVIVAAGGEEDRALDVLPVIRLPNWAPFYVVGARESHRFAAEAVRRGAADYFALPGDLHLLRRTIQGRVDNARERIRRSGETLRPQDPFAELIGSSPALIATLEKARRILPRGDVTVLITGETGTGKELLARALHDGGPRAAGPFVTVNCAAIPANLLESELFGHERGAFTDAYQAKPGLMEEADGGTLFLDEIGHLPLPLQGKLLRVIEEKRIRRVGGTESRAVDVRIIAATHVDLAAAVQRGEFREDLYYRLNVITLSLPPLRERGDDVELLAEAFARSLARRYGLPEPALSPEVRAALRAHSWPGNVRELRHAVERALLLSEPGTLDPKELAPAAAGSVRGNATVTAPGGLTLDEIIRQAVQAAVDRHGGNKSAAARELGISRQRLLRILASDDDRD